MKKLSLFILTCLLSTSWAWADTSVTEKFSTVPTAGIKNRAVVGDVCLWQLTQIRWNNDNITINSKSYRACLMALTTSGTGQIASTNLEGGIKWC